MASDRGVVLAISAPGGSGKNTIIRRLMEIHREFKYSISCTTRQRRTDDAPNAYFYVSVDEFKRMIDNDELLEYVNFCDNFYGTPKKFIADNLENNTNIVMEVEYIGALNIKKKFPEAVLIFLLPPSFDELYKRIHHRGSDSEERIAQRLIKARDEVENAKKFDYLIINDKIDDTIKVIEAIVKFEKDRDNISDEELAVAQNCRVSNQSNINFIDNFLIDLHKYKYNEVK